MLAVARKWSLALVAGAFVLTSTTRAVAEYESISLSAGAGSSDSDTIVSEEPLKPSLFDAALSSHCSSYVSDCGSTRRGSRRLLGLFAPTDPCYNDFVSPISNPLFFEDPRTLTEVRPIFVEHSFPRSQPVLQGGDAQVYAMQIRAALTQRLSFIATKDGWIDINTPGLGNRDGLAGIAAGFKYNLIRRPGSQWVFSPGFTFEPASGSRQVFQGLGDGDFHFFATNGLRLTNDLFWLSGAGFRVPVNPNEGSQMFYWSNSAAWRFYEGARPSTGWYAMWETNWFHWLESGRQFPFNFEGTDLINFGSNDVAGNDIVTMLAGLKWKPRSRVEIGGGWEYLVSNRGDLFGHRTYLQLNLRY